MSFSACIDEALKDRKFGKKKRDEIIGIFEGKRDEYINDGFDELNAERMAAEEAVSWFDNTAKEIKRRQLAHAAKDIEVDQRLEKYGQQNKLWNAANAYIEHDDVAPWFDYSTLQDRIRGQAHSMLAGFLEKHGHKGLGIRDRSTGIDNIARELYSPGSTGDANAAAFAKAWDETSGFLHRRFKAAGGSVGDRKDWRFPQHQSRWALARAGRDRWVADHMDWLDWNAMRSPDGRRIPASQRQSVLEGVFDTLKTNGHIKPPDAVGASAAVGNQIEKHRFLVFKDAESWLAMQKAYGDGNLFEVMMGHVDLMASRVAMVETFGPNPSLMKESIKKKILHRLAQQDVKSDTMLVAKAEDRLHEFDTMFSLINRENALPEANRFGMIMAGARNILTSSLLGSASLIAIPGDMFTVFKTAMFNRTPAGKTMNRYLSLMNPASSADRQIAVRSGLIAEMASQMAYAQQRLMGIDTHGPAIARRISDITMRLSLLAPHTQAMRWAFQMELMGAMAENAGKALDDVPFADMLRRHGITPEQWDALRAIDAYEHRGAKFLRPDDLYESGMDVREAEKLADAFMSMIMVEGKFAVPDSSIRGAAMLKGASRSGTFRGEVLNSLAMFKNFPMTIMFTHIRRGMLQEGFTGKASYLAQFAIGMTMAGAVGIQLNDIAKGRDPRDMTDPRFWGSAFIRGGGGALLADFVFSDRNQYGGGLKDTLSGPLIGTIGDGLNLTVGNAMEIAQGKDTKAMPELLRFAKGVTPGQSTWWARLVMDRLIWDQLQKEVDPKAYSKFKRHERKRRRDYGQRYWWGPGRTEPDRAPDFGVVTGN